MLPQCKKKKKKKKKMINATFKNKPAMLPQCKKKKKKKKKCSMLLLTKSAPINASHGFSLIDTCYILSNFSSCDTIFQKCRTIKFPIKLSNQKFNLDCKNKLLKCLKNSWKLIKFKILTILFFRKDNHNSLQ